MKKGKGQALWSRAKSLIPGGNMLLSKRAEIFLPEHWPAYFSRAKGCYVWDLEGKRYVDMSIMGIGTNTLGYGHPEVDEAVSQVVRKGNMSTLNCPEEVYLAEKLIELHPWAEMARFTRSGGEANAIAIRIARAATGREKVAVCGYHGWHDWYLAANLAGKKNLDGHLLPGLLPSGVPRALRKTTLAFEFNDFAQLEKIAANHKLAAIEMEVQRNMRPKKGFLENVRRLATKHGIVLIFDECSSGFRNAYGGIHKLYDVNPDMAMFGKALGNGYAINAVIGKKEIMQAAQNSFISSTFWTERIGPTAALQTLQTMKETKSWVYISKMGQIIRTRWNELAEKHGLKIRTGGLDAIPSFSLGTAPLAYKTIITQEMLKKGFLASSIVYVSIAHSEKIIDEYFAALEPIFKIISECENGRPINSILEGPICHDGFRRLN